MAKKRTIVCFGPGPKFKGGISNYNTALAKALDAKPDTKVHIVSWSQQYPAIIPREFVDKSSKSDLMEGTDISVNYITNYNKPGTWKETADYIISLNPEKVIFQWAIAIQGLPIGSIIKRLVAHGDIEVICDLHFVIQKENSSIDKMFTKRGIQNAHTYIVHALKTFEELKVLYPDKVFSLSKTGERTFPSGQSNVLHLYHPIYDMFKADPSFDIEAFKREHGLKKNVFLFFGFIRKYKGLHQAIEAFKKITEQRDDVSFLICGESFWNTLDTTKTSTRVKNFLFGMAKKVFLRKADDEKDYNPLALIKELGLEKETAVFNEFVANEDVHKYFQVSDSVVLYYLTATPSGIESLSYNFNLPILATSVGHFPETIEEGKNGYLAKDQDIDDMAKQMLRMLDNPIPNQNVKEFAKNLSWENYADVVLNSKNQ